MRRPGVALLLATAVAATAALGVTAATDETDLAFTLGVVTTEVAVDIRPGQEACQDQIDVRAGFESVQVMTGTFFEPAPPLDMTVADARTGAELARARIAPTPSQITRHTVAVRPVPAGREVIVCFRNAGRRVAGIYGGGGAGGSEATLDGGPLRNDMALVFMRGRRVSGLSLLPEMFRRAALFHPGFVGAWTFWALAAVFLLLVPALLARALAATARG